MRLGEKGPREGGSHAESKESDLEPVANQLGRSIGVKRK